jgi:hypothetical protein
VCDRRILVIYSDEPMVRSGNLIIQVHALAPIQQTFFHEVWLLLPPAVNDSGETESPSVCRLAEVGMAKS